MGYGGILGQKYFLPDNVVKVLEDGTLGTDDGSFSYTPMRIATGTYTGTNGDRRIPMPFTPVFVIGFNNSGTRPMFYCFLLTGYALGVNTGTGNSSQGTCRMSGSNLIISGINQANQQTYLHQWVAFG